MSHQVYSLGKLYSSFISIARLKLWSHEVLASASTLVSMLGNEFDADARRGLYGCKSMWAITSINSGDRCGQTLTVHSVLCTRSLSRLCYHLSSGQSDSRLNLFILCRHGRATCGGCGVEHAPSVGGGGGRAALRGPVPRDDQPEFRAELRRHGASLPPEEPQHQQRRAGVHGRRAAHRHTVEPSLQPRN